MITPEDVAEMIKCWESKDVGGDYVYSRYDLVEALASTATENESLRAQCGLRQIQGYNEAKAKAPPREPTEEMQAAAIAVLFDDLGDISKSQLMLIIRKAWQAMYDVALHKP